MNHEGVVLGVQDPVELAQGGIEIQGLEGVVGCGFYWVIRINFSLRQS